jgi:hypothetical protein
VVLSALLALTLGTASAQAAVTVGSNLAATANAGSGDQTYSSSSLPGQLTTSPISGVIHIWRIKGGASPGTIRFRVLRPQGGPFLGAGTGPTETISGAFSEVKPFTIGPQGLPIEAGDRIGIDDGVVGADPVSGMQVSTTPGAAYDSWSPFLADGASLAPTISGAPRELLLNADVEPDVDRDRFGDETHDACASQTATAGPCSNSFSLAAAALKKGASQLNVTVPGAGTITAGDASDTSFAAVAARKRKRRALVNKAALTRTDTTQGAVQLTLTPTKAAKKRLKEKGKARATLKVVFTPKGGSSSSQTLAVRLKP